MKRQPYRTTSRRYAKKKLASQKARFALGRPQRAIAVYQSSGELKGMDTLISAVPVIATTSTNDQIFPVNLVQQGAGSFNRIGRKIHMKSLRFYGQFTHRANPGATDVLPGNNLRMLVVYDKQPSESLPVFSDIFGTTLQDGSEGTSFQDPLRYDNMQRFRVLMEKDYPCNGYTTDVNGVSSVYNFDHYLKLGLETVFSGQSNPMTIADISSGGLYIILRAAANVAATDDNTITFGGTCKARLRYTD